LFMAGTLGLTAGCGETETEEASASIELIEPVSAAANTQKAAYRRLYDYKVLAGTVYPYVQEYSFSQSVVLTEYGKAPGDVVSKGSVLAYADDSAAESEQKSLEDKIEQLTDAYNDAEDALQKEIDEEREAREKREAAEREQREKEEKEAKEKDKNKEEEETELDEAALEAIKKAKEEQEAAAEKAEKMQKLQQEYTNRSRALQKAHRAELYELDLNYYTTCLENAKKEQTTYQLVSGMDGTVVSAGGYMPGAWVEAGTPLVAVADDTQKILKCEYVSKSDIAKCEEVYAVIGGKRYEVTYQPCDQATYERITAEGNVVYASFLIEDPDQEIRQGDFAVLVEIYSRTEPVLSIPKTAVFEDAAGSYVYCSVNGENQYIRVKTGVSDGTYIEITEGLKEGDEVQLSDSVEIGTKTVEVTRGDFFSEFEKEAFIDYPLADYISNPVENGTVYFVEYQANAFQTVAAGDVIATIHVKADETAILEKQLKLQRLKERLLDAIEEEEAERLIARRQQDIAEIEEELAAMQADSNTTEIRAATGGIIFWLADYSAEDEIAQGAPIAMVANGDKCYLTVNNENQQLNYGNVVSIEYTDQNQEKRQTEGTVVTLGAAGVSADLKSGEAYIGIPDEVSELIHEKMASGAMDFFQRSQFTVKTRIREMPGVLLIPKKAVFTINGNTYVYVKDSDGTITAQSFIAGGSNETEYWVLEGLEEGMTICLE
ncbi:MAG: efflux RND transporter periplasmic adaptor subunit, partial [Roseburia sp.]